MSRSLPPKPKPTAQEERVRRDNRLKTIRLRMAIWQELDARSITTLADIGTALGMPAKEAARLLNRHRQEGDLAALETAAARLGGGAGASLVALSALRYRLASRRAN